MLKTLIFGASALAVAVATSSAAITFDLRASSASSGTVSPGGKTVNLGLGEAGTVTLDIWAQVTSVTAGNSIWGVQTIIGSVISTGTAGSGVQGSLSVATPTTPFNQSAPQGGVAGEISSPLDSLGDLGSTSTAASTNMMKLSKPTTSGGTQVGTVFFATNADNPVISTRQAVTNAGGSGFEFLMGTITLTISGTTAGSNTLNWVIPGFTVAGLKGTRAQWTEATGTVFQGNTNAASMFVGSAISLVVVPEPSAFGMVALGALSLVGFRRFGLRRA